MNERSESKGLRTTPDSRSEPRMDTDGHGCSRLNLSLHRSYRGEPNLHCSYRREANLSLSLDFDPWSGVISAM